MMRKTSLNDRRMAKLQRIEMGDDLLDFLRRLHSKHEYSITIFSVNLRRELPPGTDHRSLLSELNRRLERRHFRSGHDCRQPHTMGSHASLSARRLLQTSSRVAEFGEIMMKRQLAEI